MGEALIKGIVEAGLVAPDAVLAFDVRAERMTELSQRYGIRPVKSNAEVMRGRRRRDPGREATDHGIGAQR